MRHRLFAALLTLALLAHGQVLPVRGGCGELAIVPEPPPRDSLALAEQYRGVSREGLSVPERSPTMGVVEPFQVLNLGVPRYETVQAELRHISTHAYWWVQDGVPSEPDAFERSARRFEDQSWPLVERLFSAGSGRQRVGGPIHILLARSIGVAGYFSSADLSPRDVHRFSNERPLVMLSADALRVGSASFDETLVHELQHLVHAGVNPANDSWMDEGAAELLANIARGRLPRGTAYLRRPDRPLLGWTDEPGAVSAQYESSALFLQYLADRFTLEGVGEMIEAGRGWWGIERYLQRLGSGIRFDDVFADWVVANAPGEERAERSPALRYASAQPDQPLTARLGSGERIEASVRQYGTDYIVVSEEARTLTVSPLGHVPLTAAGGAPDDLAWWSGRADSSHSSLIRSVRLPAGGAPALRFRSWFHTEQYYDHGYLSVSTDEGRTWRSLPGTHTSHDDPLGYALGPSYTGRSGGGQEAQWVDERSDLSDLAGRDVVLRFDYVSDQGTSLAGWIVDDIMLEGVDDDIEIEAAQSLWEGHGFQRLPLQLPSRLLVQVLEGQGERLSVSRIWLCDGETHELTLNQERPGQVIVAVSGAVPQSLEAVEYSISASP